MAAHRDIEAAIHGMALRDQVDYLLAAYRQATGQTPPYLEEGLALGLNTMERLVFCALRAGMGQIIPRERLASICDATRDEPSVPNMLSVYIHNIRGKVRGRYLIQTAHRHGYVLTQIEPTAANNSPSGCEGKVLLTNR